MDYVSKKTLRNALFNGEQNLYSWAEIEAKIDAIPAADVVHIVRCKDCLYGSENGFICGNVHGLQYAFPNSFCSKGTKRE